MGRSLTSTMVLGAVLAASTAALPLQASAADLLIDPPVVEVPVHEASGWYLRGDIGYSWRNIDSPMYSVVGATGCGVVCQPFTGYRSFDTFGVDDGIYLQGGVGYQVSDHLRVDATFGYQFETDFTGSTNGTGCSAGFPAQPCTSTDTTSYTAKTLLANAYYDIGQWGSLTPYVGAGIGGAHVSYDTFNNAFNCTGAAAATCNPTVQHEGEESWRFAWALHAGAAYQISHNLALDVGYTYSKIEGGPMFGIDPNLQGANLMTGPQGFDKGFEDHTIRVGARYSLW